MSSHEYDIHLVGCGMWGLDDVSIKNWGKDLQFNEIGRAGS